MGRTIRNGGFIANPVYDSLLFILAPLWAMAMGLWLFTMPALTANVAFPAINKAYKAPLLLFAIAVFIHAHLVIVFFRSHANRSIFALHPVRFIAAPALLLVATLTSQWLFVFVGVVAIWWDVYHSGMQTFGLGRIYDMLHGNDPNLGRRADFMLNVLMYAGPILAGVNLWPHLVHFQKFDRVDEKALSAIADVVFARHIEMRYAVIAVAVLALVWYGWTYRNLAKTGYEWPRQKALLYAATAFCSLVTWGFLSPGEAFFIMNFFHALQYFAIVWWMERENLVDLFGVGKLPMGRLIAVVLLVVPALAYGFWAVVQPGLGMGVLAVSNVVAIMHFWYDGFIWSVRRKQVSQAGATAAA